MSHVSLLYFRGGVLCDGRTERSDDHLLNVSTDLLRFINFRYESFNVKVPEVTEGLLNVLSKITKKSKELNFMVTYDINSIHCTVDISVPNTY